MLRAFDRNSEVTITAWQGYAHSPDALVGVWKHCTSKGVKFVHGEETGKVEEVIYSSADSPSISTHKEPGRGSGVDSKCRASRQPTAGSMPPNLTICALGAQGFPDWVKFTTARCWSVAHVQLSEDKAGFLRGISTTNVQDLGFFFEPDPRTRLLKLCPLDTGYTNVVKDGMSLPPADELPSPQEFIPREDEQKLRQVLSETFPEWRTGRSCRRSCAGSRTRSTSEFCIYFVPNTSGSVVTLFGDSGHGFKITLVFGTWVVQLLDEGRQALPRWRWRTTDLRGQDWGQGRSAGVLRSGRELSEESEESDRRCNRLDCSTDRA
ncbi:MAG: hypothetical protein LQ340_001603 [Diploschistes diacapsis]|nr:MAG: hypothetical protein LQ340_001603 [Diploschistes diacapsis]